MSGEEYLLSLFHKKSDQVHGMPVYINQRACPFVKYFKDKLSIKYLGKGLLYSDITSIQSNKPANRDSLIYYYEVKINDIGHRGDISVGLADIDFPLNKHPGWTKRSFGYKADGKVYNNKQAVANRGDLVMPKYTTGNYVGCGINYFKREIFFTLNGEYYGPAFKDVELKEYYPTIGLHSLNECVTFNFGNKAFKFDLEKHILNEKQENVKSILKQSINHYSLHQIVHSYLNFHGYANTLEAFEKAAQIERRDVGLPRRDVFEEGKEGRYKIDEDLEEGEVKDQKLQRKKTVDGGYYHTIEMEIETKKDLNHNNVNNGQNHDDRMARADLAARYRSDSLRLEFESPNFTLIKDNFLTDMEPFLLNKDSNDGKDFVLFKKASLHFDAHSSSLMTDLPSGIGGNRVPTGQENLMLNHNDLQPNTYYLYERANLRKMLLEGKVAEAMNYIKKLFPTLLNEKKEVLKMLHSQQFIEYIKIKDYNTAISYAQKYLTPYQHENVYCLDDKGVAREVSIDKMMALLCYPEPENSELKNFLGFNQRDLTADIVNKGILGKMGFIDKSVLDILIAQLTQAEEAYRKRNSCAGEVFEFKV